MRWTVLPPGLPRNVADRRGRGDQHRLAGDPGHLHQRVDRAVEGQRAVEEALGGVERDDLGDRSQGRRVGAEEREPAAARDRRPVSDRLSRQQHIVPGRPFGGHELDQRRECGRVDLSVVLEDEGEVERVVDDPPPGRAVAEENADFGPRQREWIVRPEAPPRRKPGRPPAA